MPESFSILLRLKSKRDGELAQRLYEIPVSCQKVIRAVLADAIKTGRFDEIARDIEG